MGVDVDLARKQSFPPNASKKAALPNLKCASTADFISIVTKFQHGIDHVHSFKF